MPYPVMPVGFLGSQGENDLYKIERSLRFNSADSAYLSRTYGSGASATTWTISCWVKRSSFGAATCIFSERLSSNANVVTQLDFQSGDTLRLVGTNTSGSVTLELITTQVFRDPSAWFHLVVAADSTQATASERFKIYINGSQVTSLGTATYPAQNSTFGVFSASEHNIGRRFLAASGTDALFNGYITEFHAIDGQALTPSSFGETDGITGRWKAKAYSGTHGTNGFYLKFADNSGTTATTLGKDSSPNGNNWTPNNFSVDNTTNNGIGNDSLVESPTNYGTDTGLGGEVRGNYCTFNPLKRGSTYANLSNGNLTITGTTGGAGQQSVQSTIGMSSGKWYAEAVITTVGAESSVGIARDTQDTGTYVGAGAFSYGYYINGLKYNNGSGTSYGASFTSGDVIGVAFNADAGSLVFYKNGVSQGTAFTGLTNGPYVFEGSGRSATSGNQNDWNFGQRPWKYAAPSGFKALCTTNLPTPTIQKPSLAMDVVTYTGNGSARSITGLGFSPDLVWIKGRSGATDHAIYDSVRGVQLDLASNLTSAETTQSQGVTAFNSDGFNIGTLAKLNTNSATYVAWAWDEAPIAGIDIVSYTGTGVSRTVPHNLGVAPKMIIAKLTNSAGFQWPVYHSSLTSASSYLWLNSTNAQATDASYWGTAPTSSVFSVGTNANVNNNTSPYIAYLFAEVEGFSKFGSFTGVASADGPFVYCGFSPKYVLYKSATGIADWQVCDSSRDTFNPVSYFLRPNASNAEAVSATLDFASNGFKLRASTTAGATFIFAAFAETPFKYTRAR